MSEYSEDSAWNIDNNFNADLVQIHTVRRDVVVYTASCTPESVQHAKRRIKDYNARKVHAVQMAKQETFKRKEQYRLETKRLYAASNFVAMDAKQRYRDTLKALQKSKSDTERVERWYANKRPASSYSSTIAAQNVKYWMQLQKSQDEMEQRVKDRTLHNVNSILKEAADIASRNSVKYQKGSYILSDRIKITCG